MAHRPLAALDFAILRFLQKDARMPIAQIATSLGIPESTARHRLKRLQDRGAVQFTALTNPLTLGYQIWAFIEIQTELKHIKSVAHRLAALPQVHFVAITTGTSDVWIAAVFETHQSLLAFITEKMSNIPGIVRTSTSNVLELVKRAGTIDVDEKVFTKIAGKKAGNPKTKRLARGDTV